MSESAPKYSIIVPAYNVESYIDDCLYSLVNLDYDNSLYEIIVVDDGSTDQTFFKAQAWKDKFENLTVVTQTNNCQGAARNKGIELARGEWLMFVDSDDWICGRNILKIWDKYIAADVDFIKSTSLRNSSHRELLFERIDEPTNAEILNGETFLRRDPFSPHIWMGCYRTQYLKQLNYPFREGVKYEDTDWSVYIYAKAQKVIVVDLQFYCYFYNSHGTTSTFPISNLRDILESQKVILKISENGELKNSDTIKIIKNRVKNNILGLIRYTRNFKSSEVLRVFRNSDILYLFESKLYDCTFMEKIQLNMLRYFPIAIIYTIHWATNIKRLYRRLVY